MQVTRQIPDFRKLVLPDQTQEDGLQYVFRVAGIAGNAIRGPEYQFPVLQKNLLQPQPEIVSSPWLLCAPARLALWLAI